MATFSAWIGSYSSPLRPLGSTALRVRRVFCCRTRAQAKVYGYFSYRIRSCWGRGLIALEQIARCVGEYLGIEIAVFGFDTGKGMPPPVDYRDLPHIWDQGFYQIRVAELQTKLSSAKLILGDVQKTIPSFMPPHPLGFIAFDVDYYSATKAAFRIFEGDHLPRVYCYFDDTIWPETACHNEYIGELCAIREFNAEHAHTKICQMRGLRYMRPRDAFWHEQTYVFHDFTHPLYSARVTPTGDQYTQKWL